MTTCLELGIPCCVHWYGVTLRCCAESCQLTAKKRVELEKEVGGITGGAIAAYFVDDD